jgi:predicted nucleic acid-binding protein
VTERHPLGLLDTSVVIDLDRIPDEDLPVNAAISAVTVAELGTGVHTATDVVRRAVRMMRLQAVEASFEPLPFDAAAARCYNLLVALVIKAGQSPRPRRLDLMIAATAAANDLPVYTRNPKDFVALRDTMPIIAV